MYRVLWADGVLRPVPLALSPMQRQVNAMLAQGKRLWLASEGGVAEVDLASRRVTALTAPPAHDLATCGSDIVAATSEGGLRLGPGGLERVDTQGVGTDRHMALTCVGQAVDAGGLEGLYRYSNGVGEHRGVARGFDAGWVTALTAHDGRLVGTYANGVFELRDGALERVRGLEQQWVTPHGLKSFEGALWVRGLGMTARAGMAQLEVPARDSFDFVAAASVVYVLTSQGVMTTPPFQRAAVLPEVPPVSPLHTREKTPSCSPAPATTRRPTSPRLKRRADESPPEPRNTPEPTSPDACDAHRRRGPLTGRASTVTHASHILPRLPHRSPR